MAVSVLKPPHGGFRIGTASDPHPPFKVEPGEPLTILE
jgi:hypothetical protein